MKKTLLTICSLCMCCLLTTAQSPILTKNKMPAYGTTAKIAEVAESSMSIINIDLQGENVTWDFSALQNNGIIGYLNYLDPSTSEYYQSLPESNLLISTQYYQNDQPTDLVHKFFNVSESKMEKVGYKYPDKSLAIYSDVQTECVFPLQYGTENEDTWDNSASSFGGGDCNLKCVGYGTLKLPDATYHNVLMVHVALTEGFLYQYDYYTWYAENGLQLVEYTEVSFIFGSSYSALYALSSGTSGLSNAFGISKTVSYNNPVQDLLNVSISENNGEQMSLTLTNMMGKVVATTKTTDENTNINMSNLPTGIYFLTVRSTTGTNAETMKIVKQ